MHRTFSKKLKNKPRTQRGGVTTEVSPGDITLEGAEPAADTPSAEPEAIVVAPVTKNVSEKDALEAAQLSVSFNLPAEVEDEQTTLWSAKLKDKLAAIKSYFQTTYIDESKIESEIAETLLNLISSKPKLLSLPFINFNSFKKSLEPVKTEIEEENYSIATIDKILEIANEVNYKDDIIKKLRILKIRKELEKADKGEAILKKIDEISLYNLNPIQELILMLQKMGLYKEDQLMKDLENFYKDLRAFAIANKNLQDFQTYNLITMKNTENTKYEDWVAKDGNDYTEYVKKAYSSYKDSKGAYPSWLRIHKDILKNRSILAKVFFPAPAATDAATNADAATSVSDTEEKADAGDNDNDKKPAEGAKAEAALDTAGKVAAEALSKISPKGLSAAFNILYDILALIAAILVVVYFILSVTDFGVFLLNEIKQKKFLIFDPNLFNQDTSEYKALKYNSNDTKSEPYNIYLEQNIIKQMYRVVGIFFVVIGLQVGSFLAFKLLASLKNQEFTESLEKPKNVGVIVAVLTSGLVLSSYYKHKFLNTIQPVFKGTQNKMTNMKDYIYNHMTTNVDFLEALLSNNVSVLIELMSKQQTGYSLSKMLFTFSLYNYFKTNVPESDEETEAIRSIFTIQQIRTQTVDPIKYFYYRQNIFIPNMYVSIKTNLIEKNCPVFKTSGAFDEVKEENFRILMNSQVLELNRGLLQLLKLPKRKHQLFLYLLMTLLISSIFVIALMVMYKDQVAEVWAIIQPYLAKIWGKITSLFSSKKAE